MEKARAEERGAKFMPPRLPDATMPNIDRRNASLWAAVHNKGRGHRAVGILERRGGNAAGPELRGGEGCAFPMGGHPIRPKKQAGWGLVFSDPFLSVRYLPATTVSKSGTSPGSTMSLAGSVGMARLGGGAWPFSAQSTR